MKLVKISRAQVALEFVILVALALTVLVIFFALNYETRADLAEEREYAALADLALSIRTELYTATSVSDGYLRIFNIPNTLDTNNFSINVTGDVIVLTGEETTYSLRVPPFSGNLTKGDNILQKKNGALFLN